MSRRSKKDVAVARHTAKNYIQFARLPYCPGVALKESTCPVCKLIGQTGHKVVHVESFTKDNIVFNMVVSANNKGEVVISFGGPKSQNVAYLQQIYANGIIKVPELKGMKIESEFWEIYSANFRKSLISKLGELSEKASKMIFVGHSFGGSIAQVASYDLALNKIIKKKSTLVFTYGALKTGNHRFVRTVQRFIGTPVVRIARKVDFFPLMPRCVFMSPLYAWHCYDDYVHLVSAFPMYAWYYMWWSPVYYGRLWSALPSIARAAQSYVNRPVAAAAQQAAANHKNGNHEHGANKHGENRHGEHGGNKHGDHHGNKHGEHNSHNNKNHNVNHPDRHNQNHHDKTHNDKHSGNNFINHVSNTFKNSNHGNLNHHNERNSHSGSNHHDRHQNQNHHNERNSLGGNHHSERNSLGSSQGGANSLASNPLNQGLGQQNQFGSQDKQSGLNQGLNNPMSRSLGSGLGGSLGGKGGAASRTRSRPPSRRTRHFLQTNLKIKRVRNSDFFRSCTTSGHYVSCAFTPEVHQTYFGVDVESCD